MNGFLTWLEKYQSIAIWLEGIALVLIFWREWRDSRAEHEETMQQIAIARKQAEAARLAAQSVVNAERAWIVVHVEGDFRLAYGPSLRLGGESVETLELHVLLSIDNDGRTPAWIDDIRGSVQIIQDSFDDPSPEEPEGQLLSEAIGALGAGKKLRLDARMSCEGKPKEGEHLYFFILVVYRDIFDERRETHVGYGIDSRNRLERLTSFTERSKNT